MKRTLLAFAAAFALFHCFGAMVEAQTQTPTPAPGIISGIPATVVQTSNLRRLPEARAEIVGRLDADTMVMATARTTDTRWLYIESDNFSGWLPAFALTLAGDAGDLPLTPALSMTGTPVAIGTPMPVMVSAVGRVNIRREPHIGDNVVGQLNEGETAYATARSSQENDWLLIEVDDEEQGWVAYFAVRVTGNTNALPVLIPDSNADLIPPSIQLTTRFNARMRVEPSLDAPVMVVVPFGALITPLGRSDNADWVFVRYDGEEGWIDATLLEAPPDEIAALPIVE